jgi:hypothetical protein
LLVKPPGSWDKFASAGRFRRVDQSVYSMVHSWKVGNDPKVDAGTMPTGSSTGRFRLIRTGPTLLFQVAEGESPAFREIFRTNFGNQDLEFIRLAATPGGSRRPVEVLWKHLTVKAKRLPGRNDAKSSDSKSPRGSFAPRQQFNPPTERRTLVSR